MVCFLLYMIVSVDPRRPCSLAPGPHIGHSVLHVHCKNDSLLLLAYYRLTGGLLKVSPFLCLPVCLSHTHAVLNKYDSSNYYSTRYGFYFCY